MDGNKKDTGKESEKGICTHLQSIPQSINADLYYGTPRL